MADITEKELLIKINENLEKIITKLDEIDSNTCLDEIDHKLLQIIKLVDTEEISIYSQ